MCVDKEDFKSFKKEIFEIVGKVKHDTGNIRMGLEQVNTHLGKLNSRTTKLEEYERYREETCPNADRMRVYDGHLLTTATLKDYIEKKQREDAGTALLLAKKTDARNRQMQWIIAAIVGAGTLAFSLISLLT